MSGASLIRFRLHRADWCASVVCGFLIAASSFGCAATNAGGDREAASHDAIEVVDQSPDGDPRGALVRAELEQIITSLPVLGDDPQTIESLRAHAERLWAARADEDWAVAWEYRDMTRAADVEKQEFVAWSERNEPFGYDHVRILDVAREGDRGWVQVELAIRMRAIPDAPVRNVVRWDRWIHEFGRWAPAAMQEGSRHPAAPAERRRELEPALKERHGQWWRALIARDWEAMYEMSDPFDRENVTFEQFRSGREQLLFHDHEVEWVQAIGDQGTVRCMFLISLTDPSMDKLPPRLAVVNERWVYRSGEWYHRLLPGES